MVTYRTHCVQCNRPMPVPSWVKCFDCAKRIRKERKKKPKPIPDHSVKWKLDDKKQKEIVEMAQYYTVHSVAKLFKVDRSTVMYHMKKNGITKPGNLRVIKKNSLLKLKKKDVQKDYVTLGKKSYQHYIKEAKEKNGII